MDRIKSAAWLERIEDLIQVLEGSSINELELSEGGTDIIIRRKSAMVMTTISDGATKEVTAGKEEAHSERSVPVVAPLMGVYYTAASPTSPAFVNLGDVVQAGQVVALVEAMKVFNEITADITGRIVSFVAENGDVVQKGSVLLRIEPI